MGPDFVEGEVDDVTINSASYGGARRVAFRFVTIRLKLSEDKFIDVRFAGYTGPITIVRGHRIRATGKWVRDNLFKANKIEDISTGEWWVARGMTPFYLVFALLGVFIAVFFFSPPFISGEYILSSSWLLFLIILIVIVFFLYRAKKSYEVVGT